MKKFMTGWCLFWAVFALILMVVDACTGKPGWAFVQFVCFIINTACFEYWREVK